MKKRINFLISILFVGFFAYFFVVQFSDADPGKPAPDFETELINGSPFKLSNLRGKYVLLEFWGSWCGPCRKANKNVVNLHKKYSDKLTVVSIALEKNGDQWKVASKQDGFSWENQIVQYSRFVLLSPIAQLYGVKEIPAKFLISPEGILLPKMNFVEIDEYLKNN